MTEAYKIRPETAGRAALNLTIAYHTIVRLLGRASMPALRIALGGVYIWYGTLKIAGISPAASLIGSMVSVIGSPSWVVPVLGVTEVVIGIWLLTGRGLRYLLPLFVAHMMGTLGVLVLLPGTAFQHHNPLELTFTGEFVTKNFVLLAAGIAVIARPRGSASRLGMSLCPRESTSIRLARARFCGSCRVNLSMVPAVSFFERLARARL